MEQFFTALADGLDTAPALQKAQVFMAKRADAPRDVGCVYRVHLLCF